MARAGADMRKTQLLQQPADRHLVEIDAEALLDDAAQVDAAPAHHAVHLGIGPLLDDRAHLLLLVRAELRLAPRSLAIDQPIQPPRVDGVHPIAQRLAIHAADTSGFRPCLAIADRRQRQQPSRLVGVFRLRRQPPELLRTAIPLQLHRRRHRCPRQSRRIR